MRIFRISRDLGLTGHIDNPKFYNLFNTDKTKLDWQPRSKDWSKAQLLPQGRSYSFVLFGYTKSAVITNRIPKYRLKITLNTTDNSDRDYRGGKVELAINGQMDVVFSSPVKIANWTIEGDDVIKDFTLSNFVAGELAVVMFNEIKLPHDLQKQKEVTETPRIRLTRPRMLSGALATAIEFSMSHSDVTNKYDVRYKIIHLEYDKPSQEKILVNDIDSRLEAQLMLDKYVEAAKKQGYVDSSSPDYIPPSSDSSNWDFAKNKSTEDVRIEKEQFKEETREKEDSLEELIGKVKSNWYKRAKFKTDEKTGKRLV